MYCPYYVRHCPPTSLLYYAHIISDHVCVCIQVWIIQICINGWIRLYGMQQWSSSVTSIIPSSLATGNTRSNKHGKFVPSTLVIFVCFCPNVYYEVLTGLALSKSRVNNQLWAAKVALHQLHCTYSASSPVMGGVKTKTEVTWSLIALGLSFG